ncbi:hypothetical protein SAMN02745116_01000 [Pilibacter termitis]|uniref:Uncharacterized protein n=1 Tax=Pilibacter termitis TaxID=263852 RepID=A0A1T4M9W4_9ENTE|nr:hypothetical protein [Pilibacter termitis]SJZ63793.1 hypothetical protein SAMN02745116_01000 [Pilibacter termitis]
MKNETRGSQRLSPCEKFRIMVEHFPNTQWIEATTVEQVRQALQRLISTDENEGD